MAYYGSDVLTYGHLDAKVGNMGRMNESFTIDANGNELRTSYVTVFLPELGEVTIRYIDGKLSVRTDFPTDRVDLYEAE